MPTKTQARGYLLILSVSLACWILGLVLPMIYVRPYPEFISVGIEPYEKSTWGTIVMLFQKEYYFAGVVMSLCSVVIPFFKCFGLLLILCAYMGWIRQSTNNWPADLTRLIALFSGYQYVDIFVGLLFLAFCNTPEVHSSLLSGYYFFLAYCLLSGYVVNVLLDEDMQLSSQMWKVEVTAVRANLFALAFMFALGFGEPMLDVAYTFHGIAMGRSRMGLLGMTYQLAKFGHPLLGVGFIAITVIIPIILGITYLLIAGHLHVMRQREAMAYANQLQKFAMTDVFCLALITFLFSVQGTHVVSSVPNGSFFSLFYTEWLSGFYVALGYGAAVFTLKWRALTPQTDESSIAQYYGLPSETMDLYHVRASGSTMELKEPLTGDRAAVPSASNDDAAGHYPSSVEPDARARKGDDDGEGLYPARAMAAVNESEEQGMYPIPPAARDKDNGGDAPYPIAPSAVEEDVEGGIARPAQHSARTFKGWFSRGPILIYPFMSTQMQLQKTGGSEPREESRLRTTMRNPVFHIKLTSWIIWGICYFGIPAPKTLTFMSVNSAVNHMLPLINEAINQTLPTSFGNCTDVTAPKPCVGDAALYKSDSGTTRVTVRWASGLNTIKLDHISIQLIPDSDHPIQMQIQGVLKDMSASILVENCIIGCQTIWDNDHGCCGKDRSFNLVVASNCVDQESNFSAASLGKFKVEWFSIESIIVEESFFGVNLRLKDITPAVESAVRAFLTDYMQNDKPISHTGGASFTFTDVVRRIWEYNINERRLECKEMLQQL
eukprot:GEMP01019053.1.p1 GENE.GEMP01019053.1~~GEMP01019053.1.p1  ORF type:complete len:776 (+),score=142.19 GEMP01019053.1:317-2644(+)